MKSTLFFLIAFLLAFVLKTEAQEKNPVLQGKDNIVWQKKGLSVASIAFSPTKPYIAIGTTSWPILVDLNTGKEIKKFICKNSITGLCFSDDGKYLFTGNSDGQFIKWNTQTWDSVIIKEAVGRTAAINMIDYNQSKDYVAIAGDETGCIIYDAKTNKIIAEWKDTIPEDRWHYRAIVTSVSFRYDGKVIAIGIINYNLVLLYNIEKQKIIKAIQGARDGIYSPTKNELIVKKMKKFDDLYGYYYLSDGLDIYQFDLSEKPRHIDLGGYGDPDFDFSISQDGNFVVIGGSGGKLANVQIISLNDYQQKYKSSLGNYYAFEYPRISKDNQKICLDVGYLLLVDISNYLNVNKSNFIQSLNIYPNPSKNLINIKYTLINNAEVKISINDILGNNISEVLSEYQDAGLHTLNYPTSNLSSGSYFLNLEVNGNVTSKKIIILR
ncbi:MAG: T9SS type A sorting domain-containing protein [Chlorobi bacterium]|nr:T9SS type A sorting domain-containing protein [Chlorobiota bacterium]